MSLLQTAFAFTAIATTLLSANASHAQSCSRLTGATPLRNALYAVYEDQNGGPDRITRLFRGLKNSAEWDSSINLIYVIDPPPPQFLPRRTFAGALAVRLVSTKAGSQAARPSHVYLRRDPVETRRRSHRERSWRFNSALRYYYFHAGVTSEPSLRRDFHTEYVYRPGLEERSTYSRDRLEKFQFTEMKPEPVRTANLGFVDRLFYRPQLAPTIESRFEAQIKYYRPDPGGLCVTIVPRLENTDLALKVTISDLDHPSGLPVNSPEWEITWTRPNRNGTSR